MIEMNRIWKESFQSKSKLHILTINLSLNYYLINLLSVDFVDLLQQELEQVEWAGSFLFSFSFSWKLYLG